MATLQSINLAVESRVSKIGLGGWCRDRNSCEHNIKQVCKFCNRRSFSDRTV